MDELGTAPAARGIQNSRMSHNTRKGEPAERHARSDRVVLSRGRWYVVTRERVDVGPYDTQEAALVAADQLAQALDGIDEPQIVLALIREFVRRRNVSIHTRDS